MRDRENRSRGKIEKINLFDFNFDLIRFRFCYLFIISNG